jgi:hypothetical protein
LGALHAAFDGEGELKGEGFGALFVVGDLGVGFAFFGVALGEEGVVGGEAVGGEFGEEGFGGEVVAGFDDEVVGGVDFLFGVVEVNSVAAEVTHGVVERADGGLGGAFGVEIEDSNGAGEGREGGGQGEGGEEEAGGGHGGGGE